MSHSSHSPCNHALPRGCCLSRILRRILCLTSLQSNPFDHARRLHEEEKTCSLPLLGSRSRSSSPGLVARLMGLESLPIEGSRSTIKGRKVIPTCQELKEDDDFFTLNFEGKRVRRREKRQLGLEGPIRDKENEGVLVNVENLDSNDNVIRPNGSESNENCSRRVLHPLKNANGCQKVTKKVKEDAIMASDESENSSPNSVLEFLDFPTDHRIVCSGDVSRLANSKMRRTLSDELQNCGKPKEKRLSNDGLFGGQQNLLKTRHPYVCADELFIRQLASVDIVKSRWSKHDQLTKEIGRDVASDIFHHLLDELFL